MGVGDGFISFSGKFLAIAELENKIFNWSGWIPLSCHSSVVGGEILGGDGSVVDPEVLKELERSAATKFCDRVFESREVLLWAVVGDHGDENDFEFTEGFVFFSFDVVSAYALGDLESCESSGVGRSWSWVNWCCERISVCG